MNDIQKEILEILVWFHNLCEKNHLTYYIIGGTMIGAIRHKGFIPWDDDADVGMPRDDYNKLINLMRKKNGKYLLESPYSESNDYLYAYGKLYDTSTTLVESNSNRLVRGVFLDIFPLDGVGTLPKEVNKNFKKYSTRVKFHNARICSRDQNRSQFTNIIIRAIKKIPYINDKKNARNIDRLCSTINWNDAAYVGNITSTIRRNYVTPKEWYGTPILYQFENTRLYGLEHYDEYLSSLYGDWEKLPPEDQRRPIHDYIYLDLNKPYEKYNEERNNE